VGLKPLYLWRCFVNPALSNSDTVSYLFVLLLGVLILRRAYAITQGSRISAVRLAIFPVFYVILYVGELAALGVGGVGSNVATWLYLSFAVDAALVTVGVLLAYRYTLRHVQIYQDPGETGWKYRLNPLLPVIYVVLFFARVGIETVLLGESPFEIPTAAALEGISVALLSLFFLVDALWGLSTGFLIGRNAAVHHEWRQKTERPGSSVPLSLP
jgi:hypothetical protein